jgi:hypothetical protein
MLVEFRHGALYSLTPVTVAFRYGGPPGLIMGWIEIPLCIGLAPLRTQGMLRTQAADLSGNYRRLQRDGFRIARETLLEGRISVGILVKGADRGCSEGRASGGNSLVLSGALSSQEHLVVHAGDTNQGGLSVRSLKEQTVCSTGNLLRHDEEVLQYLGGRLTQPDQIQPKGRHGCAQSTHLASGHLAEHQHLRQ